MAELHKDKECIYCARMFDCAGKISEGKCVNFEEYSTKNSNKSATKDKKE